MPRFCTSCGTPVTETACFCTKCGTKCEAVIVNIPPNLVPPPLPSQTAPNEDSEVLPNGSKRFLKATVFDIIFSICMPPFGFIVGALASIKGEKKRGATMMIVAACNVGAIVTFAILSLIADNYQSHYHYVGDKYVPAKYGELVSACVLIVPILWLPFCIYLLRCSARKFRKGVSP